LLAGHNVRDSGAVFGLPSLKTRVTKAGVCTPLVSSKSEATSNALDAWGKRKSEVE
jgi:hypothetical protein